MFQCFIQFCTVGPLEDFHYHYYQLCSSIFWQWQNQALFLYEKYEDSDNNVRGLRDLLPYFGPWKRGFSCKTFLSRPVRASVASSTWAPWHPSFSPKVKCGVSTLKPTYRRIPFWKKHAKLQLNDVHSLRRFIQRLFKVTTQKLQVSQGIRRGEQWKCKIIKGNVR